MKGSSGFEQQIGCARRNKGIPRGWGKLKDLFDQYFV